MTLQTLSTRNARVVRLGKLSARRRAREAEGVFVVDGPVLVDEALDAGIDLDEVFVDADRLDDRVAAVLDRAEAAGATVYAVPRDALRRVTDPVHPQAVAAIARRPGVPVDPLTDARAVLGLIGIADPGNAGTLIRSAVAAGFDAVILTPGTVEVFGPKALRASAGTTFRIPVVEYDSITAALTACRAASMQTVATTLDAETDYDRVDLTGPSAVLIGNEAHGLDAGAAAAADLTVRIPMAGPAESLNAAMAGTLVCFEMLRQRRAAGYGVTVR